MRYVIWTLLVLCGSGAAASAQFPGEAQPEADIDRARNQGPADEPRPQNDTLVANTQAALALEVAIPETAPRPAEFSLFGPPIAPAPAANFVEPAVRREFRIAPATAQSFNFLLLQTAARIAFQKKTRDKLDGAFLRDYAHAATTVRGFGDGDSWFTNFVGHPVEGATAYHIARLNGASRTGGFLWSAAYSTQFELGPWSEASIGNVGLSPVDLVVTPVLGTVLGMAEEWLQSRIDRVANPGLRFAARTALVGRALAFLASGR